MNETQNNNLMGTPEASGAAESSVATNRDAIERFWNRRNYIEEYFLKTPNRDEMIHLEGVTGPADVRVLSNLCEIPAVLKDNYQGVSPEVDAANLSVFVPGLFEAELPNNGNHPQETKLLSGLLAGGTDAVLVLKAEGLNTAAYEGAGETVVSKAAMKSFRTHLREYIAAHPGIDKVNINVCGYSEGSTQGASLTARLIEESEAIAAAIKNGQTSDIQGLNELNVKEFASICGGGLAGSKDQKGVDVLKQIWENSKLVSQNKDITKVEKRADSGIYGSDENGVATPTETRLEELASGEELQVTRINPDLFTGYEKSLQVADPAKLPEDSNLADIANLEGINATFEQGNKDRMKDDIFNIGKWAARFAENGLPEIDLKHEPSAQTLKRMFLGQEWLIEALQGAAAKVKNPNLLGVPLERVKALFSLNPDYRTILNSHDTKLKLLAGTQDLFFPCNEVLVNLKELIATSNDPEQARRNCLVMTSDIDHSGPHNTPSGVAYAFRLMSDKMEAGSK